MHARIKIHSQRISQDSGEPIGDMYIESSALQGIEILPSEIPDLIDELPVLMVAASCASGRSIIRGVGELRVKETDRIKSMMKNLRKMGTCIEVSSRRGAEDVVIHPSGGLKGALVQSFSDHRTAMSMVVAGMVARSQTRLDDVSCIKKSFPNFLGLLKTLSVR